MNPVTSFAARPSLASSFLGAMLSTSISALAYVLAIEHVRRFDSAPALEAVATLYRMAGVVSPVIVLVKGAALAAIVWAILILFDTKMDFRACIAAVWKAEPLLAMPTLCFALAAFARGATSRTDLFVPLGLDSIWTPLGAAAVILSHSVNAFTLAWPAVVWISLRPLANPTRGGWRVAFAASVAAALVVLMPVFQLVT